MLADLRSLGEYPPLGLVEEEDALISEGLLFEGDDGAS